MRREFVGNSIAFWSFPFPLPSSQQSPKTIWLRFGSKRMAVEGMNLTSSLLELRVSPREAPRKCPIMPGRLRVDDGTSGANRIFSSGFKMRVDCWGGAVAT